MFTPWRFQNPMRIRQGSDYWQLIHQIMAQVILKSDTVGRTYTDSVEDLKSHGTYVTAEVKGGCWIFYKHKNYNEKPGQGGPDKVAVVQPGETIDISHLNGSMYLLPMTEDGVVFFANFFYGGKRELYQTNCSDLTDIFPARKPGGVSSAIVLSHSDIYLAFKQKNYEGDPTKLYPLSQNPKFPGEDADAIQSVQKLTKAH